MIKTVKRPDSTAYAAVLDERLDRYIPSQVGPGIQAQHAAPDAKKTAGYNQDLLSRLIERIKSI